MTALESMSEEPVHADGRLVSLQVADRSGAIMEAARRLSQAGVAAEDIAIRRPTLDDVFLSLTGQAPAEETVEETRELLEVAA
jgi:ABC-2 type transport system ATP-binding protein